MQQSPCDVTAYHAYNGSEIAPSKMQNIASSITGCLCLRKNTKIYTSSLPSEHSLLLRKQKMIFATKPPFSWKLKYSVDFMNFIIVYKMVALACNVRVSTTCMLCVSFTLTVFMLVLMLEGVMVLLILVFIIYPSIHLFTYPNNLQTK